MSRLALAALVLVACTEVPGVTPDDVVSRTDLSDLGEVAGITVAPDTGDRVALISGLLFSVDANDWLDAQPWSTGWEFTDAAALGGGVIALSTRSDGYLFDTADGTLVQHFCYEPGWEEPQQEVQFQITDALAFDIDRGLIVAQPHTALEEAPDDPTAAFVATYDRPTGVSLDWFDVPRTYHAGGMAVASSDELWLGSGADLDWFGPGLARPQGLASLQGAGVHDIQGMAIDEDAGTLLVASDDEIVEIRLDAF